MRKTNISGSVKDGVLYIDNRGRLIEDLRCFPDCDVDITVKSIGKRSSQFNRYYWGVVVKEIQVRFRELGHDLELTDVHEYLKGRFNTQVIRIEKTGEVIAVGKTTTDMNNEEFSVYVERCIRFAAETLGITIPPPNSQQQFSNAA